jgi:hypothetical protein
MGEQHAYTNKGSVGRSAAKPVTARTARTTKNMEWKSTRMPLQCAQKVNAARSDDGEGGREGRKGLAN